MNILITSVGTATAVNLIKMFKAKTNWKIIGTDINIYGYTAGSLMVDSYIRVPYANTNEYIPSIKNIVNEFAIDVIIPINDIEIECIAKSKDSILLKKCMIPNNEVIEVLEDKYICNEWIRPLGIPIPDYVSIDARVKKICRDKIGVGSKGIRVFPKDEIVTKYNQKTQIVQEYIEGKEYTVDVLSDRNGRMIYAVPRQRIEVKNGVATKMKIEKNDQMIDYVKNIVSKLKIPGFSNYQFIKDESEKIWFIEINGRFSGGGAATLKAVPPMAEAFLDVIENKKVELNFNDGVLWNAIVSRYFEEMIYIEKE